MPRGLPRTSGAATPPTVPEAPVRDAGRGPARRPVSEPAGTPPTVPVHEVEREFGDAPPVGGFPRLRVSDTVLSASPREMSPLGYPSVVGFALRRAWHNFRLMALELAGTVVAVTLVAGIALYAAGVAESVLHANLAQRFGNGLLIGTFTYTDRGPAAATTAQIAAGDTTLRRDGPRLVGLPLLQMVTYGETAPLQLAARNASGRAVPFQPSPTGRIAFRDDLASWAILDAGHLPAAKPDANGDVDVLLDQQSAARLGVAVGDRFTLASQTAYQIQPIGVVVSGIWHARQPDAPYWRNAPTFTNTHIVFLTSRTLFLNSVQPRSPAPPEASSFGWNLFFDARALHAANEQQVHHGLLDLAARAAEAFPGTQFDTAPLALFSAYEALLPALDLRLLAFGTPIIAILVAFMVIAADMAVARQRTEIAVLRGRGASLRQVLGIALIQNLLLAAAALLIGPLLGLVVATLLGMTVGFLDFSLGTPLPVGLTRGAYVAAMAAAALGVVATLAPVLVAARSSIVEQRQHAGRTQRQPIVQRFWLDVALGVVALYAYLSLRNRGALVTQGRAGSVLIDPLLLLVPSLGIVEAVLLSLRLLPMLLAALARLARRWTNPVPLLTLSYAARQPGLSGRLIAVLAVTVALGMESSTIAHTLERNQLDAARYRYGADLRIEEGLSHDPKSGAAVTPPFALHLPMPDVGGATHVERFAVRSSARIPAGAWVPARAGIHAPRAGIGTSVHLLAIDPTTFWGVAFYRRSFAPLPPTALAALLNADDTAAIVSRGFLEQTRLRIGDHFTLAPDGHALDFTVGAVADAFPTLYARDGPFVVINLRYLQTVLGPHASEAWLRTGVHVDDAEVVSTLQARGFVVKNFQDSRDDVRKLQASARWRGLFGVLSVGFLASGLLAVVGLMVHAVLSYDARSVQLGVLRAVGMTTRQLVALFCCELSVLVVCSLAIGLAVGAWTGLLFAPFLQIVNPADPHAGVPPFIVVLSAGDAVQLAEIVVAMTAISLPVGAVWLQRLRLHEVLRLGEDAA